MFYMPEPNNGIHIKQDPGGEVLPYIGYIGMCRPKGYGFWAFGMKTGIDFNNYGLKSGWVFGAGNIYESLQTYFSSQYVTGTTSW